MASKYEQEAQQESANQRILREWIQQRIALIHEKISIYDVLRKNGIVLEYEDRPTQFSCPFHGQDKKPSARAYPDSGSGPSHAWCFVCQERWDVISIWRKFTGSEKKFTRILTEIEQSFALDQPAFPDGIKLLTQEVETQVEDDFEQFNKLGAACERRLVDAKHAYDLKAYTSAASLLERVTTRVTDRRMSKQEGEQRLRTLLDNIGKRVRACPDG